jgi:hypothetical protein
MAFTSIRTYLQIIRHMRMMHRISWSVCNALQLYSVRFSTIVTVTFYIFPSVPPEKCRYSISIYRPGIRRYMVSETECVVKELKRKDEEDDSF